jgi:hypothetical protein
MPSFVLLLGAGAAIIAKGIRVLRHAFRKLAAGLADREAILLQSHGLLII